MYKKNISALSKTNPELVQKLNEIDLETIKPHFTAYSLKNGEIVLAYNSIPLDDIYAPIENSKKIWNETVKSPLSKNDFVFVFGLGLGYLFKRAFVETNARIIMYEPNIEILRYVLEYTDLSDALEQERVLFTNSSDECSRVLRAKYITNDKLEVVYNNQYLQAYHEELKRFTQCILDACQNKLADIETGFRYRTAWVENIAKNIFAKDNYYALNFLKNKFEGKTALIAAAGPSLNKDIELIKANRNKFVIIAVNKIYEYLVNSGIIPDFTVFADAEALLLTFPNGVPEFFDTNIIMSLRTDKFCTTFNTLNNFLIFNDDQNISSLLHQKAPELVELTDFSGTTSGIAFYAAKILGFKKIIFSGLDLAFKDEEYWATQEKPDISDDTVVISEHNRKKITEITSFKGTKIKSREDYAIYIKELSEIFRAEKEIELFNLTDFGAKIDGMKYEQLENILPTLSEFEFDRTLSQFLDKEIREKQTKLNHIMKEMLLELINQALELKDKVAAAQKPNSEILRLIAQNALLYTLLEKDILYLLGLSKQVVNMSEFTEEFRKLCNKTVEKIEFIEQLKQNNN